MAQQALPCYLLGKFTERTLRISRLSASALLLFVVSPALAQQSCPAMQITPPDASKLLFSPQQEMLLGDVVSEHLQNSVLVIDEDPTNDYLRSVGERVARQLPETNIHYQFFLYDQPEIQAFGLPGGRIYVSRKMVAFLRNEDELAGVLGHELGHIVMRQANADFSRQLREVLGVQSVGDRDDIYERYNAYLESYRLKKSHSSSRSDSDSEQMIADRVGVEATARAGYSPQAFVDAIDRLMQTKGKTGSWFSDLFGSTRPDSRRLREVLKSVSAMQPGCVDSRAHGTPAEFHAWQDAVLHYQGIGHKEHLHDVVFTKKLNDPIRPDIDNFQFSPDGKYILAQDDGGISILTREPLAFKFRIDAPRALFAQFSRDSRQISFVTRDYRVDTWNAETHDRLTLSDVATIHGCAQMELSIDAKFLACFSPEGELGLYDVENDREVYHKDRFYDPESSSVTFAVIFSTLLKMLRGEGIVTMHFSPDSRYFAAVAPGGDPVVLALPEGNSVHVAGSVKTPLHSSFAFLAPDRLVGLDVYDPPKSPIVQFPSGKNLDRVPLGGGGLTAATNPRYLLIRPIQEHPVGVFDLDAKKFILTNRNAAMDIWGDFFLSERLNGEIGLYKIGQDKPLSVLQLPLGHLGGLSTSAVSPDLRWLAYSVRSRGGIFDLVPNDRIFFNRGFSRCYSVTPEIFYLSLPQFEKAKPEFVAFSGATHQTARRTMEENDDQILLGKVTVKRVRPENERSHDRNVTFQVLETEKANLLWSRTFPKRAPELLGQHSPGRMILNWPASSDGAKEEMSRNPDLKDKVDLKSSGPGDYFIEIVELTTGKILAAFVVHTGRGAIRLSSAESVGDWLILADDSHRVLLYSLPKGELKARYFGSNPVFSSNARLLSVASDRGVLHIYDLGSLRLADKLAFPSKIVMNAFSSDATKLLVLTNDQVAYLLAMNPAKQESAATHSLP